MTTSHEPLAPIRIDPLRRYGFLHDPSLLPRSYYKWICWMGQVSDTHLDEMIRERRRAWAAGDMSFPHVPCSGKLYPNTIWDLGPDFIKGLGRASQVGRRRGFGWDMGCVVGRDWVGRGGRGGGEWREMEGRGGGE